MALICGANGLCPCPNCLVSSSELANLGVEYPLRISVDSAKLLRWAKALPIKAEQEALLKKYGLHPIQVTLLCFCYKQHSDSLVRIHFGELPMQTYSKRCHLTGYMHIIWDYSVTIFGQK